jgi:pilus assembly protein CpaF
MERMKDGSRRVVQVSEVQGMESDTIVMQDLFHFSSDSIKNGVVQGSLKLQVKTTLLTKLVANSIELPENVFDLQP